MDQDKRLEIIRKYKSGNKKSLDRLLELDYPMILGTANRIYTNFSSMWLEGDKLRRMYEFEDILQEALIAYCRAVELYNEEKDAGNFVNYANLWIKGAVYDAISYKPTDFAVSTDEYTDENGKIIEYIPDENEEEVDNVELEVKKEVLNLLLGKFNIRDRAIIRMRFGLEGSRPRTLKEVSKVLGISHETVRQIEKEVMKELSLTRVSLSHV
jgi:RNA polymerase sporulation-specific sigma factor